MENVHVEELVRNMICERLEKTPEEVTLDARFMTDLKLDSLDMVDLITALEEECSIDIDDEANDIETVGDVIEYIKARMSK